MASPFKEAYVAAKHGVAGLTKTVAFELAEKNITVNAVAPGYVKTPLVGNQIANTARARGMTEKEVVRNIMLAAQPTARTARITQNRISNVVRWKCCSGGLSDSFAARPFKPSSRLSMI